MSTMAMVRYRMSDYSVPRAYGFRDIVVKGFVDQVIIFCGSSLEQAAASGVLQGVPMRDLIRGKWMTGWMPGHSNGSAEKVDGKAWYDRLLPEDGDRRRGPSRHAMTVDLTAGLDGQKGFGSNGAGGNHGAGRSRLL
ncbi:MAG: hypothetical protein WBX25_34490 [Rhodomicrobium sp.]